MVILQAVTEGRWLVIENIDMAPPDVLASLRPLLEGRPLHLPNRATAVEPAPGLPADWHCHTDLCRYDALYSSPFFSQYFKAASHNLWQTLHFHYS